MKKSEVLLFLKNIWKDPVGSRLIYLAIVSFGGMVILSIAKYQPEDSIWVIFKKVMTYGIPTWSFLLILIIFSLIIIISTLKIERIKVFKHSKPIASRLNAIDEKFYHKLVKYNIIFQEIKSNNIWLKLEFTQLSVNLSDSVRDKPIEFPLKDRKTKLPEGSINGINYSFNKAFDREGYRPYQMECNVQPSDKVEVKFSVWIEYNTNDSELFQTYRCCEDFIFRYEDNISISAGKDCFDFYSHRMHDYIGVNGQIETNPTNKFVGQIKLDKGLLPYQGIFFKWRKL